MLTQQMPDDVDVLKVEVPCDATTGTPWRVTKLSRRRYYEVLPSGRRTLAEKRRLGYRSRVDVDAEESDTDVRAVALDRVVSVTPLSLDLTSRVTRQELESLLS
jgi:5'-nucleotidase